VLDSDIPAQMLAGLDEFGARHRRTADGLRKPIAAARHCYDRTNVKDHVPGVPPGVCRCHPRPVRPQPIRADAGAPGRHDRRVREGLRIYDVNGFQLSAPTSPPTSTCGPTPWRSSPTPTRWPARPLRNATGHERRADAAPRPPIHRRRPASFCGCARKAPAADASAPT
jgi:hypothetical protein